MGSFVEHKYKSLRIWLALAGIPLLFFITACSTTQLALHSDPDEAEIYLRQGNSGDLIMVGKTPLELTEQDVSSRVSTTDPVTLIFKKNGFQTVEIILPRVAGLQTEIRRNLVPLDHRRSGSIPVVEVNHLIDSLFQAQHQIRLGNFDQAITDLNELGKLYPQTPSIHELKGSTFLLQGDYTKAYAEFVEFYKLVDSVDANTRRLITYLENQLGIEDLTKEFRSQARSVSAVSSDADDQVPTTVTSEGDSE